MEPCDYYACNREPGQQHHLDCGKFPASPEQLTEELREYNAAQQSVIDARRSANALEGNRWIS